MNNYIKSTDYLIEKALGPITEFLLWTLSVLGMIVFFPKFTLIWIVLGVFATGGFYQSFFSSKKRFLTKIRIKSTQYCSYYNKRVCCIVDKEKPVYYAVFKSNEATKNEVPYIAISNKNFVVGNNFLSSYDINNLIIVQYNQTTWHLFEPSNWLCVAGKNLVHDFK